MIPDDLRYSATHEWVRRGDTPDAPLTVGITHHAQDQLGDVVYVDLPAAGRSLHLEEVFGSVESVKTVSDLVAPLAGTVVEVNGILADQPELLNTDPYHAGWLLRLQPADPAQYDTLLDSAAYAASLDEH